MKSLFVFFRLLAVPLLASGLSFPLLHAQTSEQKTVNPSGEWSCEWTSNSGYRFTGMVTLAAKDDGTLAGQIVWTMRESPRQEERTKLGLTGTEFIRGTYDFKTRLVLLEGFRKDDPSSVIGLDRYKLVFADNGASLGGLTENHGAWTAIFFAMRR